MPKKHRASLGLLLIMAFAAFALVSSSGAATGGPAVRLARVVKDTNTGGNGQTFLTSSLGIYYTGGTVKLQSSGASGGRINTDDFASLTIKHLDGTTSTWSHDFSNGCSGQDTPIAPVDISSLLNLGPNTLTFQESDVCGGGFGGTAYWVKFP
jgi:hypothetical protein